MLGNLAVGYNELLEVFCVELRKCGVCEDVAVKNPDWEVARECPLRVEGNAIEGSLRIIMLFFDRLFDSFPFAEVPGREDCEGCDSSAPVSSACSIPLNQPMPNS